MTPKYLLITTRTIHIPGDERSRTNPGHGYPESTESVPVLKYFDSDQELINYMETWGKNIKDPLIFELAGKVSLQQKTTVQIVK